jgi:4-amino-4-deoxy-L-arabinose transferase-like glycosyltransferase
MFWKLNEDLRYGIILVALFIPLFGLGLSNHGLWTDDEPRVAEIGREMAVTGNWAVPSLNQRPFLEKPPLYFWALAATFRAYGQASDRVARIPSAVFGFGGAVAVFLLGRMLFGARVGFLSAFILATSFKYFRVSHWVLVDTALAFFVIAAMTVFMAGYQADRRGVKFLYYMFFYVLCGLAFLSKGAIGLVFPGLGILVFLVFERNLKEIWKMHPWFGIGLLIAVFLPWLLALWQQGGSEFLDVFFVQNHLQRFLTGGSSGHHKPFYYYLPEFPESFLPWSLLLIPFLYWVFSKKAGPLSNTTRQGLLFMKCWFISGFLFLSIASTKRDIYLLPILAPMSVLTAWWIGSTLGSRTLQRLERIFLWILALAIVGAGLALGAVRFYLSREFAVVFLAHTSLAVGLSVGSLKFLREKRMGLFWIGASGALWIALIFILVWIVPSLDRYKSFVPFCEEVREAVGTEGPLYAYKPDETLRGVVPFYTGRYLEEIHDESRLQGVLHSKDRIFIIAMDKRGNLEKEVLSTGSADILVRQTVGGRRVCLLFTNRGVGDLKRTLD